jgi:wyosine [tRNA(Phe)-imidazoG37] synthetase (radical SAM superfamily)
MEKELQDIKRVVERISPDRVYMLTPVRPPAESLAKPDIVISCGRWNPRLS